MILWRKINKILKELYRKVNLNDKLELPTNSKATRGGRSSRTGQEPEGTSTHPAGNSKETCDIPHEGLTQAVEAISTLDMSVGAVFSDYPP